MEISYIRLRESLPALLTSGWKWAAFISIIKALTVEDCWSLSRCLNKIVDWTKTRWCCGDHLSEGTVNLFDTHFFSLSCFLQVVYSSSARELKVETVKAETPEKEEDDIDIDAIWETGLMMIKTMIMLKFVVALTLDDCTS